MSIARVSVGRLTRFRRVFFATPFDAIVTLILLGIAAWTIPPLLRWTLLDATWSGETKSACINGGACWAIVTARWRQVFAGFFPEGHLWRVALAAALLAASLAPVLWRRTAHWTPLLAPLGVALAFGVLGGAGILPDVPSDYWGGFFLNVLVGVAAAVFALPLGIVLALARCSEFPVVKMLAVSFIEVIRAAPLIVLLFAASVVLPLLIPQGVSLDKLTRALLVVSLFEAAYMAEAVRGGLLAVPKGQREAARALGFGPVRLMSLVVLPQALRIATPALVNSFIGLFKDTTLIYVVGILDITGVLHNAVTDYAWQGLEVEVYVCVALVFWAFCFALSRVSLAIERRSATPST